MTCSGVQCGRATGRGRSRGVEQGSVHQGAIITILDQVIGFAGQAAALGLVDHFDPHRIFGVVEVDDVDVKDQNGGAGNEFSCGGKAENIRKGAPKRARTQVRDSPTPVSPYAK